MEDVGRAPAEASPLPALEPATIPTLDGWIESLMACKQLAESDVQRLCDKVRTASAPFYVFYSPQAPFLRPQSLLRPLAANRWAIVTSSNSWDMRFIDIYVFSLRRGKSSKRSPTSNRS